MTLPTTSIPEPDVPETRGPQLGGSRHPGSSKGSAGRRVAVGCASVIVLIVALIFGVVKMLDQPRPDGVVGPEADALARRMMAAVDVDAWQRTGAVRWDFAGRQQHLWDRQRNFVRVRFDGNEVLLDLDTRHGLATARGEAVEGPEREALLTSAWEFWVNDSFWLNPVAKLFDDGTERALVSLESGSGDVEDGPKAAEGLLVTYTSGGVTPGDAYLWIVGPDGLPIAWRMWTEILPAGGIDASWDGWTTLATGAKIATRHHTPIFELVLSNVEGAATLGELLPADASDPFAPLAALLADVSP